MKLQRAILLAFLTVVAGFAHAQTSFGKATAGREDLPPNTSTLYDWWNLLHYTIDIKPDYDTKFISGTNTMRFEALRSGNILQISLQEPMVIKAIDWNNSTLLFQKEKNNYLVHFPRDLKKGTIQSITIHFEGHPKTSLKPPFDNGWIWKTDQEGRPWMSVACEGSGASIWLPCKEVLYDEPDNGVLFSISVPDSLVAVANGRLIKKSSKGDKTSYTWDVKSPINNYNIIPYIGKYVSWHEQYAGIKGKLDCDFWVLDYNMPKARQHLKQVDTMLRSFEYWFGPYPFYQDSYKLVEAPMPGMEHQSAIAYGNEFKNGYAGKDISGTGWGLKWDFILVHESGHEWFGNSITASNHNDTWIHEGFTKYAECLYTSFVFGKQAGDEYAQGLRKRIKNDAPVLGSGSSDQYYKGSVLLHTIRQIIGDDKFRSWLRQLNKTFYHQTVQTKQIIELLNLSAKKDFTALFNQYLTTTKVPELEYIMNGDTLEYRWSNCVDGFDMPINISLNKNDYSFIYPTTQWQKIPVKIASDGLVVDKNFYVTVKKLKQRDN